MRAAGLHVGGITLCILLAVSWSCEPTTSPPHPNSPPNTTVANIPKENDTLFALATVHWDGEDNDGFIQAYQYRYVTYHRLRGDSVVHDWQATTGTSLTIAFESSDILNYQVFQVRAVDNDGAADPSPAEKRFYTKRAIFPVTELIRPTDNTEFFAVDEVTDWWPGIQLTFTARDQDGEIVEYAWAVDGSDWNWTNDTTVFVPPGLLQPPVTGTHIVRVTCRDNTNLVDPDGDSARVRLVQPSFTKRILIIDETRETNFPAGVQASDASVDSFYADVFGTVDSWDYYGRGSRLPGRDTLGQYRLIVWHADDLPRTAPHALPDNTVLIEDYLNVGGKFFMSGWRILKSFAWLQPFPVAFEPGSFVYDYLHIVGANETTALGDFTYAEGFDHLTSVRVDSAKIALFPYNGKLGQINFMSEQAIGGFAKKAYLYQNAQNSPNFQYRGQTCGLIYYGTTFDTVVLGFPVFFMKKDEARVMATELLQRLGI